MSDLDTLLEEDQPTKPILPEDTIIEQYRNRLVEGAKRYASYDRSDPFTMDRCCGHIRQGLCKSINPFREEADEEGNKRMVPTGLPWHWDEPIYETIRRPDGVVDLRETGRKRHCRTEIIGDAGAPGHYDALVLTSMRDGEIEIIHKNLRRP